MMRVVGGMTQPVTMETEKREAAKARRRLSKVGLNAESIERFLDQVVDVDWHVVWTSAENRGNLSGPG
jgi:hypothetical protein